MLIDTHVHLQHYRYTEDVSEVLDRALVAGVLAAVVPGTTGEDSAAAVAIARSAREHQCAVYAAVGIHPTEADALDDASLALLADLALRAGVVAIGEIGLDYYWPRIQDRGWRCADPAIQRRALARQLSLASDLNLPVIVHDRDAHRDTLDALGTWKAHDPRARGTLHAYAAGPDLLNEVVNLGFHIGMDGPVTFRKAVLLHRVAQSVPAHRLLLETDGPYLSPAPHRGKRNEPAYLTFVAAEIAELRGVSGDAIADTTTRNASELFGLQHRHR